MTTSSDSTLRREISALGYGAMVLNGMIGAGIFALPAVAAAATGLFSPWMFVICGLLIMTVVFSMAKAASLVESTGGPTVYSQRAFGHFTGFQVGWLFTLSRLSSMAANTNLLVTYAAWFWAPLDDGLMRMAVVTLILGILAWVNVVGIRQGMTALFVFTLLKMIPLSMVIILGISQANPEIFTNAGLPVIDGLGETVLVLLYAFVGFESTAIPAGEGKNPSRDIPRALIYTTVVIAVVYFLIQLVTISVDPGIGGSERPMADIAEQLMGSAGAALLAMGAVFSISGNLSSMMLSAPRMLFAMAREGMLPEFLGAIHPRFQTPANAIILQCALGVALALSGTFVWLAAMSTAVRLFVYVVCILSLPRLEKAAKPERKALYLPGGWLIPGLALVLCVWLISHASLKSWLTAIAFAAAGSLLYLITKRRQAS